MSKLTDLMQQPLPDAAYKPHPSKKFLHHYFGGLYPPTVDRDFRRVWGWVGDRLATGEHTRMDDHRNQFEGARIYVIPFCNTIRHILVYVE